MNKQEIIAMLKEENILEDIEDGPTAVALTDGKKDLLLQVNKIDDYIEVTTGKIFKRKIRIPISDMES